MSIHSIIELYRRRMKSVFFNCKGRLETSVMDAIHIHNMTHLDAMLSSLAKTMQMDFGFRWDLNTAEEDDERAIAIAIAGIYELGGQIVSEDAEVMSYVLDLRKKQVMKKYFEEGNNG